MEIKASCRTEVKEVEHRYLNMEDAQTREDGKDLFIEGYFAVFDSIYELWEGATESIARGAFDDSISDDVRALYNHNMDIVLGRTSAGTMELKQDSHGLWGSIRVNRNDSDAMNAYARIARGDITGCSFGFDIGSQEVDYRDDGSVHWTITKVSALYEISPCTFPAYQETVVSARKKDLADIEVKKREVWREAMKRRLRGE